METTYKKLWKILIDRDMLYCKGRFEQGGRNCLLSRVDIAWGVECKP